MSRRPHRLLRASAGTGKTYQLVQTYADLVEEGLRPAQIVAITFTRKAAAELKGRIRLELVRRGVEREVVAELARAPIANFHVLSLQMLRAFGFTAGIPEGLQLLGDQGDDRLLFLAACEEAWFGDGGALDDAVLAVAPHLNLETEVMPALWEAISKAREDGRAIAAQELLGSYDPEPVRELMHEELVQLRSDLEAVMGDQTPAARRQIESFLAATPPSADAPYDDWGAAWSRAAKLLNRRSKYKSVFTAEHKELITKDVMQPLAADVCGRLVEPLGRLIDAGWAAYTERKTAGHLADFSDLVEGLVRTLSQEPELHRAVRERVDAVLVDEAQDTNRLQRRLVHLLCGFEGPASGDGEPASLFVVGDRKQAIYTFRGADPRGFDAFVDDVKSRDGEEEPLSVSRRSGATLVAAINSLGERVFEGEYEPLEALDGRTGDTPAVTYLEVPPRDDDTSRGVCEAEAVAAFLRAKVDAGIAPGEYAVLLANMTRAPLYATALARVGIPAVLGSGGGLYEQPEMADVIALLSWLTDSRDQLSAAIALRSPLGGLSDTALMALFRDHGRGLYALRRGELALDVELPSDAAQLEILRRALPELVAAAGVMPAADLLAQVFEVLDVRATTLALDGGEQRVANLDRLWEVARQFDDTGRGGAERFAREQRDRIRLYHKEPMVPVPAAQRRAVTITTVHQSKGLEYPGVIMADLRGVGRGDKAAMRYSREEGILFKPRHSGAQRESGRWNRGKDAAKVETAEERKRVLYVAVTRARRELVFVGAPLEGNSRAPANSLASFIEPWVRDAGRQMVAYEEVPALRTLSLVPDEPDDPYAESWAEEVVGAARARPPASGTRVALPVTQLETYLSCLRRGLFLHELGLADPERAGEPDSRGELRDPPLDPLTRGRLAHAVLEGLDGRAAAPSTADFVTRELRLLGYDPDDSRLRDLRGDVEGFIDSELGCRLLALDPDQRRHELPFQLDVPAGEHVAALHGQIDLLYFDGAEPVVIDFKHARGTARDVDAYATQLDAYASAVAALFGIDGPIRAGLVFLRSGPEVHERVVTAEMRERFSAGVAEVTHALLAHRPASTPWPGRERAVCEAMGCGFVGRCHAAASTPPPPAPKPRSAGPAQLDLPLG